jgi:3'-phosphoadenosine 5'-phosphosulfate sulfotransferase (PAPS reductase)/FAD synthetase
MTFGRIDPAQRLAESQARKEPKHVIGLSGGKDSTALALRLIELYPERNWELICNATGDELPDVVEHWRKLEVILDRPIKPVRHTKDLNGLIEEQGMLPNFRARWCTRILKIEPTIAYMESLPAGSVLYVGLRADEEERQGLYGEDITVVFPMREWGWKECDVWAYLDQRGVTIPKRTDCARCYGQRIGEWRDLWLYHPAIYAEAAGQERKTGHTFRSDGRDTWHASLDFLAMEFAAGRPVRERKTGKPCRVCSL